MAAICVLAGSGCGLMGRKLTAKQEAFVREYLKNGRKATAAYQKAFPGCSQNVDTIGKEARRLLKHPLVTPRLNAVIVATEQHTEMTIAAIKAEYAKIARADIRRAVRWRNEEREIGEDESGLKIVESRVLLIPSEEIDDDTAAAISEIAMTKEGIRIKFHSKIAALDSLSKINGMFVEKTETKVTIEETPEQREQLRYVHEMLTRGPMARPGGPLPVIDQPARVTNGAGNGALNGKGHK